MFDGKSYFDIPFSRYVDRFIQPGETVSDACREHLARKPVFLPRGVRSYRQSIDAKKRVVNLYKKENDPNAPKDDGKDKTEDDEEEIKTDSDPE